MKKWSKLFNIKTPTTNQAVTHRSGLGFGRLKRPLAACGSPQSRRDPDTHGRRLIRVKITCTPRVKRVQHTQGLADCFLKRDFRGVPRLTEPSPRHRCVCPVVQMYAKQHPEPEGQAFRLLARCKIIANDYHKRRVRAKLHYPSRAPNKITTLETKEGMIFFACGSYSSKTGLLRRSKQEAAKHNTDRLPQVQRPQI